MRSIALKLLLATAIGVGVAVLFPPKKADALVCLLQGGCACSAVWANLSCWIPPGNPCWCVTTNCTFSWGVWACR